MSEDPTGASVTSGQTGSGAGVDATGPSEIEELEDLSAMQLAEDASTPPLTDSPHHPFTLAIDIGGTGLKASVLDASGSMVAKRVRVPTTYPMQPEGLVDALVALVAPLPEVDRVAAGFPGMVRGGRVLSAPHFSTEKGPGSPVDHGLRRAWSGFDLAGELSKAMKKPTKVANDADVQGAAVVAGRGLEFVITLGTGFGTSWFLDGGLLPHIEIAHIPFRKGETYNDQLGERARKEIGDHRWNRRVRKAVEALDELVFFDHLYVGGGNARRVVRDELGERQERITVVSNAAGILGGIKLWEHDQRGV